MIAKVNRAGAWLRLNLIIGTMLAGTAIARGYALIGGSWPTGNIPMTLQLDATAPKNVPLPLQDGSPSWSAVAQAAMDEWNNCGVLTRSKFTSITSSSSSTKSGDKINNVFFSSTVYGDDFGTNVLAITQVDIYDSDGLPTVRTTEADLVVNNARTWNSYGGALNSSKLDLKRVLVHELGHVLGLDHPDTAIPPQTLVSIMNSTVGNLEIPQTDDLNGISYMYGASIVAPVLTQQPASQSADVSASTRFTIGVNGAVTPPAAAPALLSYRWYFKAAGTAKYEPLFTIDTPNLDFGTVQLEDAGSYYLLVMTPDPDKTISSNTVTLTVNPVVTTANTSLANLSNRGMAGGSRTMIVGFVVTGTRPKSVLLRGVGPMLTMFHVGNALPDPKLTLTKLDGTVIATSGTTWDGGANAAEIRATSDRVGAFGPLPAGSRDAVILTTVQPGLYTVLANSVSGDSGVVLVEAYDADATQDPNNRLANLSTRGYVGTGENVLIAGFVVRGPGPHTYLIRAAGPTLSTPLFNVPDTLFDPMLKLYNDKSVLLRETDDWDSPVSAQPALQAAFDTVHAFGFTDRKESAMLVTLQPGLYSAQASGNDNGGTTSPVGNAIIEIYELP
jgi:hypothetical protein